MALVECGTCKQLKDRQELFWHAILDYKPMCMDCVEAGKQWH